MKIKKIDKGDEEQTSESELEKLQEQKQKETEALNRLLITLDKIDNNNHIKKQSKTKFL